MWKNSVKCEVKKRKDVLHYPVLFLSPRRRRVPPAYINHHQWKILVDMCVGSFWRNTQRVRERTVSGIKDQKVGFPFRIFSVLSIWLKKIWTEKDFLYVHPTNWSHRPIQISTFSPFSEMLMSGLGKSFYFNALLLYYIFKAAIQLNWTI